ncbi:MAG: oligosaccharide flippase family protein [Calditrichia bacterium]
MANNSSNPAGGIRRLFQHSAIYALSSSIQRLQGLIMIPIYTSAVYLPDRSEFANYGLVYTFIAFMNFVYLYGMDSAFLRYFFLGKSDRKTVFSTTFLVLFASGVLTSLLLTAFAGPLASLLLFSPELDQYIRLAALILLFDSLGNLPFLILRSEERPVSFTVFRMIRFSLELLLNIFFVVILKKGVIGILYANLIAAAVNMLVMSPFGLKYFKFGVDRALLKEMVRFGLPFLPNGIAYMVIEMMDRFLVTEYLGKDTLAFYHANYKFASVLLLVIVGFRNAWQPFFLKIANQPGARRTYSRILNLYLVAAGGITLFVTFFIQDLLTLHWFGEFYLLGRQYWEGIPIIPWIVLSYFFFGIYTIFTPAFYITKKSHYMILFTGAGALLNVGFNLYFLPQLGIWAAVAATVLAYFAMAFTIYLVAQRIYPIPLNLPKIGLFLLLVGSTFFIYYIIAPPLLWRILSFLILFGLLIAWGLSGDERAAFRRLIHGEKTGPETR